MSNLNKKEFFSTSEAAALLNISRIAVFKKIQTGIIPATKVGRSYVIARQDMEAIMGSKLTSQQLEEIKKAVKKATNEFREAFERLAKE